MISNRFLCLHDLIESQEQRVNQIHVEGGKMYERAGVFVFDCQSAQHLIENATAGVRRNRRRSERFLGL
jgi:hypothetical protein